MKKLVLLAFCLVSGLIHAQRIVDQFGYSSALCSGTYYLYEDSSFVYERGCEERSSITLGKYLLKGDSVLLYPKRFEDIDFIRKVEYVDTDTTGSIVTNYVPLNDTAVTSFAEYPSVENARRWAKELIPSDSLRSAPSVRYNVQIYGNDREPSENYNPFGYARTGQDTLAIYAPELELLLKERTYHLLPPDINEVRIYLNLPHNIVSQLLRYKMKYKELKPTIFKQERRIVKVQN